MNTVRSVKNEQLHPETTRKTGLFISKTTGAIWLINDYGDGFCVFSENGWWQPGDRYTHPPITEHIGGVLIPYNGSVTLATV